MLRRDFLSASSLATPSCNDLKLGTATFGAFESIAFSNSVISNGTSSPLNAHVIGGINVEMVDGGNVDGVVVSNIRMQNVRTPIFVPTSSFVETIIRGDDSPSATSTAPAIAPATPTKLLRYS
jgi:hypothetical protein